MKRLLSLMLAAGFCGAAPAVDPDAEDARLAAAAAQTCFRIIEANYDDAVRAAEAMELAVKAFAAAPDAAGLARARAEWCAARAAYAPTEAYRFSGGPIDAEGGPEELLNAWPIDESVIDRVPGSAVVSIIEDAAEHPVIDDAVLTRLNMREGEKNITCGWHAVEFLLWGQDRRTDGAGDRPAADFTTTPHAGRRREFLVAAASGIVPRLAAVRDAWRPGVAGNHRAQMEARDADEALRTVVKGMIMLAGFELASERIGVPCETCLQEDEQSCFSDTTLDDVRGNVKGIVQLWEGRCRRRDGSLVTGASLRDLTDSRDAALAAKLDELMAEVQRAAAAVPGRFDQAILEGADGAGKQALRRLAASLDELSTTLKEFAARMGRPFSAAELEG